MKIIGETFFLDTNILISATDQSRSHHHRCRDLLDAIPNQGGHLVFSGQIIREYLVVATRPIAVNGLGLDFTQALENIETFQSIIVLLPESQDVTRHLLALISKHHLSGKRIHDANVVATMISHGIHTCISDDAGDYKPFEEVQVSSSELGA